MAIKTTKYLFISVAIICNVLLFSSCDKEPENALDADYMEEATIFAGPTNGGIYDEAQTTITLLWEGHSLSWSTAFVYPPQFYISNVTDGDDNRVTVTDCKLTSLEGGGLNGVILDFSRAGVTQTPGEQYGTYEMVYGEFEITIPAGLVESASVEYNPEQKIQFSQVKKSDSATN